MWLACVACQRTRRAVIRLGGSAGAFCRIRGQSTLRADTDWGYRRHASCFFRTNGGVMSTLGLVVGIVFVLGSPPAASNPRQAAPATPAPKATAPAQPALA